MQQHGVNISHDPLSPGLSAILVFGAAQNAADVWRAQQSGVRVVQRLNGMNWVHRRKFTGIRHFIKAEYGNLKLRQLRNRADSIIYQSGFAHAWWERENGTLDKPQFVIYNGVDLALFSPEPANLPDDRYRVLMVEGHHGGGYEGGLITAARFIQQLRQQVDRPCELAVVGDVPFDLRRVIQNTGAPLVWLGVLKHSEIPSVNRSAHLLYSGDINAACPNSVLEAMACGLPVIAYDTGALPELVSEDAGRIAAYGGDVWQLEPPDIPALTSAALQVLQGREALSRAARQRAEAKFDIEKISEKYLEVLLGD
jgi:glycosyltransferase involved in cell wall biosynthesis